MKNTIYFIGALFLSAIVIYTIVSNQEQDKLNIEPVVLSDSSTYSLPEEAVLTVSESTGNPKGALAKASPANTTPKASSNARPVLNYTDEWCNVLDLSEADQDYAKSEIVDWQNTIGDTSIVLPDSAGHYYVEKNGLERIHYLEIEKSELKQYIQNGDPYAMLAALDRQDLSSKERRYVAYRLLYLGYTGKAIAFLVRSENGLANTKYLEAKQVTSEVKQHLSNALVYSNYSLRLHDARGLITFTRGYYDKKGLNPAFALSESDLAVINRNTDVFAQAIQQGRDSLNLPPIERELTRVAQQQLDWNIGVALGESPQLAFIVDHLIELTPALERNDCQQQMVNLYQLSSK